MFRKTVLLVTHIFPMLYSTGKSFSVGAPFIGSGRRMLQMRASSWPETSDVFSPVQVKRRKKGSVAQDALSQPTSTKTSLYKPRTPNQKQYVKYLADPAVSILLGVGPAGTGKTLFACNEAVRQLKQGVIQKIILTRPIVPVEEELGFLPGSLNDKMDPWTRPIFDILSEVFSKKDLVSMMDAGTIEISPLAFMRGRTFKQAFVIADEMQNSSPNQMLMLTTRLGEGSKMVITGDVDQSDRTTENGLVDFIQKLSAYRGSQDCIHLVELNVQDVQRSRAVSTILDMYSYQAAENPVLHENVSVSATTVSVMDLVSLPTMSKNDTLPVEIPRKSQDCALIPDDPFLRPAKLNSNRKAF